ncbi:MAG: CHAP domain-containing protein [Acetobacteraceae bacterium]
MRARATGGKWLILCSIIAMGATLGPNRAEAYHRHHALGGHRGHAARYVSISCVPFARQDSGIEVAGNAWEWWENAAGLYARGQVPEAGSVLNFEANRHMRYGHVAVVSRVISRREIEVDQANWPYGRGISRSVPVVDVSDRNDWSAVRVGLGRSGDFGSVYPTYGFIYGRRDNGVLLATARIPPPRPVLSPAPADLRGYGTDEEVAEAPAPRHAIHHASAHRHGAKAHTHRL